MWGSFRATVSFINYGSVTSSFTNARLGFASGTVYVTSVRLKTRID